MQCVTCVYCGVCQLPAEYCEFGPSKKVCKEWQLENMPRAWLIQQGIIVEAAEGEEAEALANLTLDGADGEKAKVKGAQTTKKGGKLKDGDKVMPGGKVKKKQAVCILVQRLQRNKRKFVTVVTGLEHFGVKLKDAAQAFKKKFSCGSSVVAGECGKPDEIDIQGDFVRDTIPLLLKKFPDNVVIENIYILDNGKRICATEV